MASRYSDVLLIVVPAAALAAARTAYRNVEAGDVLPGNDSPAPALFLRGLSPTGEGAPTHYCIGPKVTAGMLSRLAAHVEPLAGVRWARLSNPEWRLRGTNVPGAPSAGTAFGWEEMVGLLGLGFVQAAD